MDTTTTIDYIENGSEAQKISTIYYYDNVTHAQPTRTKVILSQDREITTKATYADDILTNSTLYGGNLSPDQFEAISALKIDQQHLINIPIQIEKFINGERIETTRNTYKVNGTNPVQDITSYSTAYNELEARILYIEYDDKNNLLEIAKKDGPHISYLCGYNSGFPIAETKNSTINECGFTGFENEELNGWTKYTHNSFSSDIHFTGKSSMMVSPDFFGPFNIFSVGNNALNHCGYKASVWVKGNKGSYINIEIDGEPTTQLRGIYEYEDNQWHLIEVEFPRSRIEPYFNQGENLKVKVYVGAGSGSNATFFDDLRLCPMDAQMTTYTYEPLIGMTSISDVSNKPTYYEYDPFGRLKLVKDYLGNILKKTDYHYHDSQ